MAGFDATIQRVKNALKSSGKAEVSIEDDADGYEDTARAMALAGANEAGVGGDASIEVTDGKVVVTASADADAE